MEEKKEWGKDRRTKAEGKIESKKRMKKKEGK